MCATHVQPIGDFVRNLETIGATRANFVQPPAASFVRYPTKYVTMCNSGTFTCATYTAILVQPLHRNPCVT